MQDRLTAAMTVFIAFGLVLLADLSATLANSLEADEVLVEKSNRLLHLLRNGHIVRSYRIALGSTPVGPKRQEGDGRTPEGRYVLDWRNGNSRFHRSIHISYPNSKDARSAHRQGRSPGGDIMIHGLPNGHGTIGAAHAKWDWTDGCIAVTNREMDEIWQAVPVGTPIRIKP